jgi:HEAT repeat protein
MSTERLADLGLDTLWQRALAWIDDDEIVTAYLVELHRRGSREIFDRAIASCSAASRGERELAIRTLRELGGCPPRFAAEAVPYLLAALAHEPAASVRRWLISALGYQHMRGHRGAPPLSPTRAVVSAVLSFVSDEATCVRFAVAAALPCLAALSAPEPEVIAALIRLSADPDADTRYYALAALVDDLHHTGEDMDAALARRLDDPDRQIQRAARRVLLEAGEWAEG